VTAISANSKYSKFSKSLEEYKQKMTNLMYEKCMKVIDLIRLKCLPLCQKDHDSLVHFLKTIADFYRYIAEIPPPDKADEVKQAAMEYYKKANDAAKEDQMESCNPIYLGLTLNKSVFYYEIMQDRKKACLISEMCLQ